VLTRTCFIASTTAALVTVASPKPSLSPKPSPSPTPFPWDMCDNNPVLPYDKPLGLHMRVLDGADFDLIKYRGYAVVLNIFATWCGPCAAEMPSMVDAAAKYHDKGLRIVGIDFNESDDTVRAYRKKYSIGFPVAMDEHGEFTYSLERGIKDVDIEFPVSLYISPDGYLYCYNRGSTKSPAAELAYRFEKFLRDEPPTRTKD